MSTKRNLDRAVKYLGNRRLKDLTAEELNAWARSGQVAPSTAIQVLMSLSACLRACKFGLCMDVPNWRAPRRAVSGLRLAGYATKKRNSFSRRITDDTIEHIISHWSARDIDPAYLWLLVDTCMRSGELVRLQWRDVQIAERTIIIRDRKHPTMKKGNDHKIALLGRSLDILRDRYRIGGLVLPVTQKLLSANFKRASQRAGYKLRLHDLRHEGISRLAEVGFTSTELRAQSGHSNVQQVAHYTHHSPEHILEKFDNARR